MSRPQDSFKTRVHETFRTRLRQARTGREISQREIVARLKEYGIEMHQPSYSQIESGNRQVALVEAAALAQILNAPLLSTSWEDWLAVEFGPPSYRDHLVERAEAGE